MSCYSWLVLYIHDQTQITQQNAAYSFKIPKHTITPFNYNVLETQKTQLRPTFSFFNPS